MVRNRLKKAETKSPFVRLGEKWQTPPKEFMGERMEKQGDLVQGTLDMLVLKALARGAKHGYGVAE